MTHTFVKHTLSAGVLNLRRYYYYSARRLICILPSHRG